jgi:hypothetical protein
MCDDVSIAAGSLTLATFAIDSLIESITCGWALVVMGALIAQLFIDAWWIDPLASLGVVWSAGRR